MTLSDVASLSTALSGLAVTASLIYLARQTHQNARHTKALIQQGRAGRSSASVLAIASSDLVSAWIAGNGGTPTQEAIRQRQFDLQCGALLIGMEDVFT